MLSPDRLEAVAKLAGIQPKKPVRVSGTRAKLLSKKRPKKALKARGKIKGRDSSSETKISTRKKTPKSKLYGRRKQGFKKKTAFLRKGESTELPGLVDTMRHLLSEET